MRGENSASRPGQFYFEKKKLRHQLNVTGVTQSLDRRCEEEKKLMTPPGNRSRSLGRPTRSMVTTPTELPRLRISKIV
jgi:hypothetical protein